MNEIKDQEPENEIKDYPLPQGFTQVIEEDIKNEESIYEVIKSEKYSKIFPSLILKIDEKIFHNKPSEDFPFFTPNNRFKFLPKLDTNSEILSNTQLKELHLFFPYFYQYSSLTKIFSLSQDGSTLKSLYKKCEGIKNSILVIKDKEKNIFGAFVTDVLHPSANFIGTPDSFLFTFYKEDIIHVFKATQINDKYIYCDFEQICFGSSGEGFSLSIKNDLLDGYTKTTDTYKNQPLTGGDKFTIVNLEIWAFKQD